MWPTPNHHDTEVSDYGRLRCSVGRPDHHLQKPWGDLPGRPPTSSSYLRSQIAPLFLFPFISLAKKSQKVNRCVTAKFVEHSCVESPPDVKKPMKNPEFLYEICIKIDLLLPSTRFWDRPSVFFPRRSNTGTPWDPLGPLFLRLETPSLEHLAASFQQLQKNIGCLGRWNSRMTAMTGCFWGLGP